MPTNKVTTRFAPSPTGLMHLGNVRTALLNWLFARKHSGRFLLRFEDTDADRSQTEYIEAIRRDLDWLSLDRDGTELFQSAHADKHRQALEQLAETGLAYRCFCSEHQLALDRRLAASRGLPPRYAGRCRVLPVSEADARAANEPFVWRLAVHDDGDASEVVVHDALRGDVCFARRDLDDPVVSRSDGSFTFLLPNAVDDALDAISHVLRGDDHLTNSAYQVWLLVQLGHVPPVYLHHGLLLGEDGSKLSKRSGSHSVTELRDAGLLPDALVQAMVRLGHANMPEDADIDALMEYFEPQHMSASAVRWQDDELWRWHTRLLHALPVAQLLPRLQAILPDANDGFAHLVQGNLQRVEDALHFRRLLDAHADLDSDALVAAQQAGEDFYTAALAAWQDVGQTQVAAVWKAWADAIKAATGVKGRGLFMPLRVALSGATHGPEMSHIVEFLGVSGVETRLQDMQARVSKWV
ncbi:MAG: glutamate--tRNA ligase [Mariprofundaceae bacterium]|nr:glutamate--tRNA ligase [Mariprofundaceae bacterium]